MLFVSVLYLFIVYTLFEFRMVDHGLFHLTLTPVFELPTIQPSRLIAKRNIDQPLPCFESLRGFQRNAKTKTSIIHIEHILR